MAAHRHTLGRTVDVWGAPWAVHERRPTRHGWMIEMGYPAHEHERQGIAIIVTQSLAEYIIATRPRDVDLPIGGTAIKRIRRYLGVRWDWDAWWGDRSHDLLSMTLDAFAAKHGCSIGAAIQRRNAVAASKQIYAADR